METKLYIGNLSYEVTEEELRELFSQAGGVKSVSLVTERGTGRPRGFGFVEMETSAEAQKAISTLNGHTMHDRQITVAEARPREERPRGVGGGGGPRRGGGGGGGYDRDRRGGGGGGGGRRPRY